jgi:hypothetical protein
MCLEVGKSETLTTTLLKLEDPLHSYHLLIGP